MKKIIVLLALLSIIACSDDKPEVVQPPPPPTTLPPPVVEKGVWCEINEADFSPCNPDVKEVGSECEPVGQKSIGCKSFECKHSCNPVMNFFYELF